MITELCDTGNELLNLDGKFDVEHDSNHGSFPSPATAYPSSKSGMSPLFLFP